MRLTIQAHLNMLLAKQPDTRCTGAAAAKRNLVTNENKQVNKVK